MKSTSIDGLDVPYIRPCLVFVFSFTLFRDINENNELKLQLFYKQLALGI